jgi:hypothetical protein
MAGDPVRRPVRHAPRAELENAGVSAMLANTSLPKRMQLNEQQYFWQSYKNTTFGMRELRRRLRTAWTDLGHPQWADILTPALVADGLERLRASELGRRK